MTHHPVVKIFLTLLACLATWGLSDARADFGDCTNDGYLGLFPDAPSAPGLNCIETFRFAVSTPGGKRRIRGIQDISADWAFRPGAIAAVESGARLAAAAFSRLGDFQIDDVTLLILDDAHADSYRGTREIAGIAGRRRKPPDTLSGECLITLYLLGPSGNPDELAVTVAHEIFHCLQYASVSAGQMSGVGAGADWWIEGSAEYFAAMAVPNSLPFTAWTAQFDAAVDAGTALNSMSYEAVTFFYWMHGLRGPSFLVPFMRGMASDASAGAQHAAMRSQLSDVEWLEFAQDYTDQVISHPHGSIPIVPPDGETLTFDENETHDFPLAPFVLSLGRVNYDCGKWRNTLKPDRVNFSAQEGDPGSAWRDYPDEYDAREDPPGRIRIVGLNTTSETVPLSIEAERIVSCEPCGGTDELDVCLAGSWILTGGGPIEWMRRQGIPITSANMGPRIVTFRDDGVYGTQPFEGQLTIRDDDFVGRGEGYVTVAAGRWSAKDGRLAICQDSGGLTGEVTLTHRGVTGTMPINQPGGGELTQDYSCSETSLSTSLEFSGMSPMATQYTKLPEIEDPGAD